MAHDYINMTPEQLSTMEREAYAAGDTDRAALLAAVMDLIETGDRLEEVEEELKSLKDETQDHEAHKSFFEDCFSRLDGRYPCPEVTSDYDCSVIFDAIEAGEDARLDAEAKNDD